MKFNQTEEVYLYNQAIDMRGAINKLSDYVQQSKLDPYNGYYVFFGKRKKVVKILYWENDGYCLWQKRLEAGSYKINFCNKIESIKVSELKMLLLGMEKKRLEIRKKFEKKST